MTAAAPPDPRAASARVEELLAGFDGHADPAVRDRAEELVAVLLDVYGAALARMVGLADAAVLDRFAADDLVSSLLILHDLHPRGLAERVRGALDRVRPYLGSHAGGVSLSEVTADGVVRLRLEGSCDGCPSSAETVRLAIERAIEEAAPDVVRVDVENVSPLIPVDSLRRRPAPWQAVPQLAGLGAGELRAVDVAGARVAVCRTDGHWYAYRDACPTCGSSLVDGALSGEMLACPGCGAGFDVHHAGRGDGGRHLDPLPLLVEGGSVRIAVGPS